MAAADSINALFLSILGRLADAANLNADVAAVNAGLPLAELSVILATSAEAAYAIGTIYQNELGRAPDATGLGNAITYLAKGGSLAVLTAAVATSGEAMASINAAYQSELGRAADAGGMAAYQAYLGAGGSLTGLRAVLAGSAEGQADIAGSYQSILGRAPTSAELVSQTAFLTTTGSLAGLQTALRGQSVITLQSGQTVQVGTNTVTSTGTGNVVIVSSGNGVVTGSSGTGSSSASVNGTVITTAYIAELGRNPSSAESAAAQATLAGGGTLAALRGQLAASQEAQADISGLYQQILSRAPTASDLASAQAILAGGGSLEASEYNTFNTQLTLAGTSPVVLPPTAGTGPVVNSVAYALATSAEAASDLTTSTINVTGRAPNAIAATAAVSELNSGRTLSQVQSEIAQLSGTAQAAYSGNPSLQITPQTIAGAPGSFIYSALNNDAIVSASATLNDTINYAGGGNADVTGFNPLTDFIQIQASQTYPASAIPILQALGTVIAGVHVVGGGNTSTLLFNNGGSINLNGVSASQLTAANFHVAS